MLRPDGFVRFLSSLRLIRRSPGRTGLWLAAAAVLLFGASPALALDATWNGSESNVWALDANWSAAYPTSGDTATFNSAGGAVDTIDLGTGITVKTILFDTADAAAYTIGTGGSQALTLDNAGAVTVNSTVGYNELINAAVLLGNDGTTQTFTLTGNSVVGALTLAGNITGSAGSGVKTIEVTGAGSTTLSGTIANGTTGSVAVTKDGTGRLTLSGNNSYTGVTTLNSGVLRATSQANALGTGVATLSLAGGKLELANDAGTAFNRNTTVSGDMTIVSDRASVAAGVTHTLGTLAIGAQTLSIARGANVNSGTAGVTFGATSFSDTPTLNLGYGTLLTLGAITDNGNTVTFQGGGNFAQSGVWGNGAGGVTINSSYRGIATLSQANTFSGTVTLQSGIGTLAANGNAGALGTGALDLQGGVLDFRHSAGLAFNNNTTVNGNATIITEKNVAGAGVTYALGTLNINGAYTLAVRGGNVNSGTAGLTFGATTLGGNTVIDTWNPTVGSNASALSGNVLVTVGPMTGNGYMLTKNGSGTLMSAETSGTPFGDGNIVLNGGMLLLAPGSAGASTLSGVNAATNSTFTYRSGTVQLTKNGTSLDYTIGHADAAADSVLVRSSRGTLVLAITDADNFGTATGTERFIVNGQTVASNKDGASSGSGIYNASVVVQEGTGDSGIGSFVVADTAANGGFAFPSYSTVGAGSTIAANTVADVGASISINGGSNPYALRVGAVTLTNSGTTTVNGGAASETNSGLGGVILNPTATASTITGGVLAFGSSEGLIYVGSGTGGGTIASQITGTAGLTAFGPGTLKLTNTTSNYTGGTTINGAKLWITNEAQLGTAAAININGGGTLLLSDAGAVASLGAGRNIVLGPGIQNIVKWTRKDAIINGVISGEGGVNFGDTTAWGGDGGGGGRFKLYGANTYTGDTIITYTGTKDPGLYIFNNLALQNTTVDYNTTNIPNGINAGSMIMWGAANPIIGGFKGNRDWNMSYQTSPASVSIGNNNQDTVYSGNLSSSNTSTKLIKIGTGTLVLSGNNTYAGITEVQNGTLVLAGANTANGNTLITSPGILLVANNLALQNSAYDTASTGTLSFDTGIDTPTFGGLVGSVNITLPANITTLTLNPQSLKTYSGVLDSTTPGMSVIKAGAQVQILSGQNTYSGNTILTGGGAIRMGIDPVGSLGSITSSAIGTGGLVFNGGALASDSTSARTVLNPVTFTGNATLGDATANGKLTFSANADLGAAVRTITVNSEAQFDGVFSGSGGITKSGTGTLILNGDNCYTGQTTVGAGRMIFAGDNTNATWNPGVNAGAIAQFNSLASIPGNGIRRIANSGTVMFGPDFGAENIPAGLLKNVESSIGTIAVDNFADTNFDFLTAVLPNTFLGAVSDQTYTGTYTPNGAYRLGGGGGTLTLSNTNALTGDVPVIIKGAVVLAATNNITGVTTINSGGTLTLDTGMTGIGSTSIVDNGMLVINNADAQSYSGVISGSGAVTKSGVGQLTLTAQQTYTGATTINAGTLALRGGNNTLVVNKAMTISGGTLDLGTNSQYVGTLSGTSGAVTGTGTLTINQAGNTNVTFGGIIGDSGNPSNNVVNLVVLRGNGVDGTSSNNLNLTNNNTTTGTVTLRGGDNPTAQPSGYDKGTFNGIALNDAGRLSGVTGITLNNGTLFINNSASYAPNGGTAMTSNQYLSDRVNDAAPITLNGGRLWYKGRDSTASAETLGDSTHPVTVNSGMGVIYAYPGSSNSAQLTLGSLVRSTGATLNLDGTNLGTAGNSTRIFVTQALSGNLASVGSVGVGIVPGVFANYQTAMPVPVGYSATYGFAPLGTTNGPTSYTGTLAAALDSSNVYNPSAYVVKAGGQTINSMVQSGNITFDVTTPGTLTIASGMFIQATGNLSIGTVTTPGQLTSGLSTGELFLTKSNGAGGGQTLGNTKVYSVITDNGATPVKLVVSQYCRDNLNANFSMYASNTYTGGTVVSGGNTYYLYGATEASGVAPIPAATDPTQGLIINNSKVQMQTTAQQIAASNIVTLNDGSNLTLVGANNTLAGIVFNSNGGGGRTQGTIPTVTGGTKMTITGNISSTPTDPTVTPLISVALDLNGSTNHDITVASLPQGNFVNNGATVLPLNGLTISSVISNGGFTKKGTGVLNLTGVNAFGDQLTIQEGVLNVAAVNNDNTAGPLGQSTLSVILGGTDGKTGGIEYTGGTANSSKKFTMADGGTGLFQIDAPGTTLTINGSINGDGGLLKTGPGTLSLTNSLNAYAGNTIVDAGTLSIANFTLSDLASVSINSGAKLNLVSAVTDIIAGLTLGGAVMEPGIYDATTSPLYISGTGQLQVVATTSYKWIGGTAGGDWNDGANWNDSIPAGAKTAVFADADMTDGAVDLGSTGGTVGGLTFNSTATSVNIASSADGKLTLDKGGSGVVAEVTAGSHTISAPITGSESLTKTGPGTLALTSTASDYTGEVAVSAGTLEFKSIANAGAASSLGQGSTISLGLATLKFTGDTASTTNRQISLTDDGTLDASGSALLTLDNDATASVLGNGNLLTLGGTGSGRIDSPVSNLWALEKIGDGTWTLSAAVESSHGTTVTGGTLVIGSAGALPAGKSLSIGSGGTLILGGGMAMGQAASTQATEPVPEPGTLALLAIAALAGVMIWRKKRD